MVIVKMGFYKRKMQAWVFQDMNIITIRAIYEP